VLTTVSEHAQGPRRATFKEGNKKNKVEKRQNEATPRSTRSGLGEASQDRTFAPRGQVGEKKRTKKKKKPPSTSRDTWGKKEREGKD